MNIQQEIQKALDQYLAGDLQQAKHICKKILKNQPQNAEVLFFLGVVYSRLLNYDLAIQTIKKSLQFDPNNPDAFHLIGISYQEQGRLDEAIEYYRKTIEQSPNYAEAYNNLGNLLKEKRQLKEAIGYYQKAVQLKPGLSTAHYNLGIACQEMEDYDAAITHYRNALRYDPRNVSVQRMLAGALQKKAVRSGAPEMYQEAEKILNDIVETNPNDANACNDLGNLFQDQGRIAEALAYFRKAIVLNPQYADAYFNLADALRESGQGDEAISTYRKVIRLNPNCADAYNNLGLLLIDNNLLDEAIGFFQKALQTDPNSVRALTNLGNVLSDCGRAAEAAGYYRRALAIDPGLSLVNSNMLLSLNYTSSYGAEARYTEHLSFAQNCAQRFYPLFPMYPNQRHADRILRIGYVSPDFRRHSVAYFIEPVMMAHNRGAVEVFCYADIQKPDDVTERMRSHTDHWRDIAKRSDERVAELIREDGIDFLVDLTGHTENNRMLLFARKPAPVQASWIGYPATTGLATMDYKIVDANTDPPGMTERYYTENLIRLPGSFLCYLPERIAPDIYPLPALSNGYITFGSFNNLAKISDEIAAIWGELLRELPTARFILKAKGIASERARTDVKEMFRRQGINADRIELLPYIPGQSEHLAVYNKVDIALDTFPYNGTTTTCEALYMGVPVISLAGTAHASRVGASLLSISGLPELVAHDPDEYRRIVVNLAGDPERLSSLRKRLRMMVAESPLTDAKRFTANLEQAYREMWARWCRG